MKKLIIYSILILTFASCKQKTNDDNISKSMKAESQIEEKVTNEIFVENEKCASSELNVYLNDPDKSGTNIRRTPNGEIITQLITDDLDSEYFLILTEAQNGWFKIKSPIRGMESHIELPDDEGWIHSSVISVDTRNYANQHLNLLDNPRNGKVITTIKKESFNLRIKDICGEWTKIEYNKYIGWIESKWLCGNPLTSCS